MARYGLVSAPGILFSILLASGDDVGQRLDGGWIDNAKLSVAHGNGGVLSSQVTNIWGVPDTL